MKNFKLLFITLTLVFTSCNSDENTENEETTIENIINIDDEETELNFAFKRDYNNYYEIIISDKDFLTETFSEEATLVGFLINSEDLIIKEGTFTFSLDSASDYNPEIHYFDNYAGSNLNFENGDAITTSDTFFENASEGEVSVTKNNDVYDIVFNFTLDDKNITGSYTGIISDIE